MISTNRAALNFNLYFAKQTAARNTFTSETFGSVEQNFLYTYFRRKKKSEKQTVLETSKYY